MCEKKCIHFALQLRTAPNAHARIWPPHLKLYKPIRRGQSSASVFCIRSNISLGCLFLTVAYTLALASWHLLVNRSKTFIIMKKLQLQQPAAFRPEYGCSRTDFVDRGSCSSVGRKLDLCTNVRPICEDVVIEGPRSAGKQIAAVLDGHGGPSCAQAAGAELVARVLQLKPSQKCWKDVFGAYQNFMSAILYCPPVTAAHFSNCVMRLLSICLCTTCSQFRTQLLPRA